MVTSRFGRHALRHAILSIAALGLIAAAAPEDTPADPAQIDPLSEEQIVALERERYRRVTVPVSVQGSGPYRFLVDTGAEATVVSHEIAAALSLPSAGRAVIVGMASEVLAELVDVENLSMGGMDFCCLVSPVLDRKKIGADGILGLDSLQDSRVLIDFEEGSMTVQDAREKLPRSGFEIIIRAKEMLGQLIIARASVDGVPTSIIIDTGSQITIGNSALARAVRARRVGEAEWEDVHGNRQTGDVMIASQIKIDTIALGNIPFAVADAPPFAQLGLDDRPALILGMKQLELFRRVAIDFESRRILFDLPANTKPTSDIFKRIGGP